MKTKIQESLEQRRSNYSIGKDIGNKKEDIIKMVKDITKVIPDSYNMQSSRVVVLTGEKHDLLWDEIYNIFGGKVKKEKIDKFKAGYGTILYFYDDVTLKKTQEKAPLYVDRFPFWVRQSVGMLQLSIWSALKEMNIGASLQHYNPVIDDRIKELFDLPKEWILDAQMPFGNILKEEAPKAKLDIDTRVRIID